MAVETITPDQVHKHARQWEHTALTTELLLACGVVVLSILGIAGVFPTYLAAIAVIGLGAILLFQGATVVLHYGELLYEAGATDKVGAAEVSRGLTTEFLAGMTGIVLGVLALVGIVPTTLLSVAVVTYGGTLLLTSGALFHFKTLTRHQENGATLACLFISYNDILIESRSFLICNFQARIQSPGRCIRSGRNNMIYAQTGARKMEWNFEVSRR
jgi:hypothetical protein